MKQSKKIIGLMLSCVFAVGTFASCSEPKEELSAEEWQGRGVHTADIKETDAYVIKNGATEYKLLLPETPELYETEAALLINEYMELACGTTFSIVYSTGEETAESGKYISLGDTSLMRKSGIAVDADKYGSSGFTIVTKGDDIYVSGARHTIRQGTYYGAQEFLYHTIGWRAYSYDEIQYNVLNDVKLCEYKVVEIPEFDWRSIRTYRLQRNPGYTRSLRLNVTDETTMPFGASHSHLKIVTIDEYYAEHPEWFFFDAESGVSSTKGALCLSNDEMTETFIKELAEWFQKYPDIDFAHVGTMDTNVTCKCNNCIAWLKANQTKYSGQVVDFTNRVARGVNELIQQTEPDRHIVLQMFAYSQATAPPVHEENGEWVADSPLTIPDENVYVQYAPIYLNWSELLTDTKNKTFYDYLEGWSAVCLYDNLSIWQYIINFDYIFFNHKNWDNVTADLRTYSDAGTTRMFMQGTGNTNQAAMVEMRNFVQAQLMWNPSLDYQALVDEFIEHYYGPAAPYISEMYEKMTSYYEYLNANGLSGGLRLTLDDAKYWSFAYVDHIKKIMESAFDSLKPLEQKDKTAYDKYYWRVASAYLENLFMQIEYYRVEYGKQYTLEAIDFFEEIIDKWEITQMGERASSALTTRISKWRATYA